ncbi:hypothetical protein P2G88_02850 [Aliiglaciecola sp. CAU 1673]|uniref:hypothetical protein n=1 Tax=Aliiglaciecola sp. CAU 1673 TaxID=3032595 RepID=UPI0023DC6C85|nr:hypothetical protein [Aliiglaciecola sp. CAU 1673]MDF2177182.1 hypothetical protein [Aliiglaciecola sp. CAU 1673]
MKSSMAIWLSVLSVWLLTFASYAQEDTSTPISQEEKKSAPIDSQAALKPAHLTLPADALTDGIYADYYQLLKKDIQRISDQAKQIGAVLALQDALFPERYVLDNNLRDLLRPLNDNYEDQVEALVGPVCNDDQGKPASCAPQAGSPGCETKEPLSCTLTGFTVNKARLETWQKDYKQYALTADQLTALSTLQDKIFTHQYQLKMAWHLSAPKNSAMALPSIRKAAAKTGDPPTGAPLNWQAIEDCACSPTISEQDKYTSYSYGMLPSWQTEPQQLDFGALNRIGLTSFTLESDDDISPPPNWKNERPYSDFIYLSQTYDTKVDLVLRQSDKGKRNWLDSRANQKLTDKLAQLISQPLDGFWLNNLKPWISFGFSERTSMAQGISLDLDWRYSGNEEQQAQIGFIKSLKQAFAKREGRLQVCQQEDAAPLPQGLSPLKALPGKDLNRTNSSACSLNTDRYYVNLVIPVEVLIAQNDNKAQDLNPGFYSFDNLATIEPFVNLFLVDFQNWQQAKQGSQDLLCHQDAAHFRQCMEELKAAIDSHDNAAQSRRLLAKMLPVFPLAHFAKAEDFNNALLFSDWNFSGAALWPLPLTAQQQRLLSQVLNPPPESASLFYQLYLDASQSLCALICPNRWPLRLVLFSLLTVLAGYGAVSLLLFELRELYDKTAFIAFLCVLPFAILTLLWCDPFWHRYQELILVITLVFFIFLLNYFRSRRKAQQQYP